MAERKITASDLKPNTNPVSIKALASLQTPEGAKTTYRYRGPFKLIAKLYDAAGNQIPMTSKIHLGKSKPGSDYPRFFATIPYSGYYDLDETRQRDLRFLPSVMHNFAEGISEVENGPGHSFTIYVESTATVDLSKPGTRLEFVLDESN